MVQNARNRQAARIDHHPGERGFGRQIEHSVPALMVPPKAPTWLTDSRVDNQLRASYRIFTHENRDRPTVLFVGAADGMLHAFDAGSFRWGDNPATPDITELRGYFRWEARMTWPWSRT